MTTHRSPYSELDFSDLERMDLPEEVKTSVKQARIEAAGIQALLEPFHIWSWTDLLSRLEDALNRARQNAELLGAVKPQGV